jgi:hypothetical protein
MIAIGQKRGVLQLPSAANGCFLAGIPVRASTAFGREALMVVPLADIQCGECRTRSTTAHDPKSPVVSVSYAEGELWELLPPLRRDLCGQSGLRDKLPKRNRLRLRESIS